MVKVVACGGVWDTLNCPAPTPLGASSQWNATPTLPPPPLPPLPPPDAAATAAAAAAAGAGSVKGGALPSFPAPPPSTTTTTPSRVGTPGFKAVKVSYSTPFPLGHR